MKIKTKRVLALVLAFFLTASLLPACAKETDENQTAMQELWTAYLDANDRMYSQILWAFDYAEQFTEDGTWESLQKARAACSAAIMSLQQMELPEDTLTQEQYSALMEQGIEADVVSLEVEYLKTTLDYKLTTLTCLMYLLRDDVYLAPSAQKIGPWVESNRNNVRLQSEYLCLTTNYLLLQMDDDSLWEEMPTRFPTVGAYCGDWIGEADAVQLECSAVLDEMESQLTEESEYLGISDYTLKIVEDAVESGDMERLSEQMYPISGVSAYFPLPSWVPQENLWYYLVTDPETQEKRLVQTGEEITQPPSACYIPLSGITREAAESYEERLDYWGIEYYSTWDEESREYQILAVSGESKLLVSWSEEETVLYLTEPVGCLIPELYFLALQMQ